MNIYEQNETNFENNGLGFLTDVINARIEDNLNGDYSLFFEYKLDGNLSEYLQNENIVKCKVADGSKQLFVIKNIVKTFNSIQVVCKHIFYQLLDNFVEDTAPTNLSPQQFLTWILDRTNYQNNFKVYSDITTTKSARYVRKNPVEIILGTEDNSMISLFGGELKRDNFDIRFNKAIGNDNGVKLMVGKNITGINISIDTSSVHTRIMPQGYDGLFLPEKYVDSPLIDNYLYPKIYKVEFSDIKYDPNDENAYHTLDEAYTALRNAVNELYDSGIDKPIINVRTDWRELSKTNEYKNYSNLERVSLGDTITVDLLNISYKSKVIKTTYNVLTDKIESFEVGSPKANIGTSTNNINKIIEKINPTSILEAAKDDATKMLTQALGGYVVKTQNELLIMDTDDINTATKVWRWNMNGLGYSESGIDGPYSIAMTADGKIVADFIATGKLDTSVIEGYESLLLTVKSISEEVVPTKQANGNPIEIEDAGEYPLESIEIDGKSYQDTYRGVQLLNISSMANTETKNGVTCNVDKQNGIITLNGTCTTNNTVFTIPKTYILNGTYSLSYKYVSGSLTGSPYIQFLNNSNWTGPTCSLLNGSSNFTTKTFSNLSVQYNGIRVDNGNSFNNYKIKIQLEKNDKATEWEPYVGGIPSPNSDYSQEIKTVKGVTNEFDINKFSNINVESIQRYVQIIRNEDGSHTLKNTNNNPENLGNIIYTGILKSGTYTVKNYSDLALFIKKSNSDYSTQIGKNQTYIFSYDGTSYLALQYANLGANSTNLIKAQLEQGSIAHPYVPYGTWLKQITKDKNNKENTALINMNKPNYFNSELITKNIDVNTGNDDPSQLFSMSKDFSDIEHSKDITVQLRDSVEQIVVFCYDSQDNYLGFEYKGNTNNTTSLNKFHCFLKQNTSKVKIRTFVSNKVNNDNIVDIHEGYSPYYEFVEVGDTKDNFLDGILTKNIGKIDSYNGEAITTDYISTTGSLTTGATIYYVLAEPKQYKLNYEPLKLFKGYNYITLNDELYPNMSIEYLVDSKSNATYATRGQLEIESNRISSEVNGKFKDYSTTTEMNNKIEQEVTDSKNSITLEVSNKYSTKGETATAKSEAITSANNSTDNKLKDYSTTKQVDAKLELKVGKSDNDQVVSMLNASANQINLKSNRLVVESTQFTLDKNGNATFKGNLNGASGSFSGSVTSKSGTIGGWTIGTDALYSDITINGYNYRTYIQTALKNYTEDSWIFSTQKKKTTDSGYTGTAIITMGGDGTFRNLTANGNLTSTGNSTISGNLNVYKDLTVSKKLQVYGNMAINGYLDGAFRLSADGNNFIQDNVLKFSTGTQYANNQCYVVGAGYFDSIASRTSEQLTINSSIEMFSSTPYIDFHWNYDGSDFTARILENQPGHFQFKKNGGYANCQGGSWTNSSSKLVKKNIEEISDEEAKALLELKAVSFDYKNGVDINQRGFIAEDVMKVMEDYVVIPENYDESKFDATEDENGNIDITQPVPSLDYSKFVVPLVKLCQIQQKQIDDLVKRVEKLENEVKNGDN